MVPAGTHEYSVTFYPDNSSYYNTAALSVAVKVDTTYKVTAVQTTGGAVNVLGKAEDNVYVKGQKISLVATLYPTISFQAGRSRRERRLGQERHAHGYGRCGSNL